MIIERNDYSLTAWLEDLINIIKKRSFLAKKEDAFLVVLENIVEFEDLYQEGMSPMEAFLDYNE